MKIQKLLLNVRLATYSIKRKGQMERAVYSLLSVKVGKAGICLWAMPKLGLLVL